MPCTKYKAAIRLAPERDAAADGRIVVTEQKGCDTGGMKSYFSRLLPLILDAPTGFSRGIRDGFVRARASVSVAPEEVFQRAYAIWEREGCPDDRQLDHWLQAESELSGQR